MNVAQTKACVLFGQPPHVVKNKIIQRIMALVRDGRTYEKKPHINLFISPNLPHKRPLACLLRLAASGFPLRDAIAQRFGSVAIGHTVAAANGSRSGA